MNPVFLWIIAARGRSVCLFLKPLNNIKYEFSYYIVAVLHKSTSVPTVSFYESHKNIQEQALNLDGIESWFYILIFHSETLTLKLTIEETDNFPFYAIKLILNVF